MTRWTTILTFAFMIVLAGCADDAPRKVNNAFDVGEQTDGGGVEETGNVDDMGVSGTITFTLVNDTERTIFTGIGAGTSSCAPFPFLRIAGADATPRLRSDCATCICGEEPCAVCDCAIPDQETYALEPGASREFAWDKMFWEVGLEGGSCQAPRGATGDDYIAEFCFSDAFVAEQNRPKRQLCQSVEFGIDDAEVSFTVEESMLPTTETELRLVNDSGQPIYVRPNPGSCHASWFDLRLGGESLDTSPTCETCNCNELAVCTAVCPGAACPAPMLGDFEVLDSESRTFLWDHTYWPQREIDGESCEYPAYAPPGTSASVEFCFAREVIDNGQFVDLGDETCETLEFTTNDDFVELRVP